MDEVGDNAIVISASVVTENEAKALRALDAFSRAAAGLAFEGMLVSVTISKDDEVS